MFASYHSNMRNTRSSIIAGINPMGAGMVGKLKKIGLSLSVIVLFALYAGQRQAQTGTTAASLAAIYTPGVTATSASSRVVPTVTPRTSSKSSTSTSTSVSGGSNSNTAARAVATVTPTGAYRDGNYTGTQADAHWGTVEVVAVITNGQLSDVQFKQYPNHRDRSKEINYQAMPMLTEEAIQSQRANVDIISGATDTSEAFIMSLSSALAQAAS
jgi:uncharacterized protein with FMN-binding domain